MTKPKQDALAQENLEQQGYEVYRPLIKVQKISRGKPIVQNESLFPRYLFIHLNDTNQNWAPIRSTKGVLQMVCFGSKPAKVSGDLIALLRTKEQVVTTVTNALQKGEELRVEAGPFYGLEAVFEQYDANQRIVVLMNLLGQQQKVVLNVDQVTKQA